MRKPTTALLLLAAIAALTACNKSSDPTPDNPLAGTWNAYHTHDSVYSKRFGTSIVTDSTYTGLYQKYIFRADYTCTLIDSTGHPGFVAELQYKVAGNQFILGVPGAYDTAAIAISGSQFSLTYVRDDAEGYWQSVIYCQKL